MASANKKIKKAKQKLEDDALRQEWEEFVPELLQAVKAGYLDRELGKIVRGCYARRGTITGTNPLLEPSVIRDPPPPAQSAVEVAVLNTPTANTTAAPATTTIPPRANHTHHAGLDVYVFTGKVTSRRKAYPGATMAGMFEYDGAFFPKTSVVGRYIYVPQGVTKDNTAAGLVVQITGVGPARVKAILMEHPYGARQNSPLRTSFNKKQEAFWPRAILRDILEAQVGNRT